jgi:hypothetical protein
MASLVCEDQIELRLGGALLDMRIRSLSQDKWDFPNIIADVRLIPPNLINRRLKLQGNGLAVILLHCTIAEIDFELLRVIDQVYTTTMNRASGGGAYFKLYSF